LPESGGRNPFKSTVNVMNIEQGSIDISGIIPRLTGISYRQSPRPFGDTTDNESKLNYAIINNRILKTGEKIDEWQVILINRDYVKIKNNDTIEKLTLGEMF